MPAGASDVPPPDQPDAKTPLGVATVTLDAEGVGGFWIETTLVDAPATAMVVDPATGFSATADLRPVTGEEARASNALLKRLRSDTSAPIALEIYPFGAASTAK